MIADEIKALLPSTWPLTIGDLPSTNVESVCIIELDGNYNTHYFRSDASLMVSHPLIKIVGRSASYETGSAWMDQAKETLNRYHSDGEILGITMVGTPMYLGRDNQKFHEFQVTFQVQLKE